MSDWADTTASQLMEQYAIMHGDRLVVLKGGLEAALATRLRIAHTAGKLEGVMAAQKISDDIFGKVSV